MGGDESPQSLAQALYPKSRAWRQAFIRALYARNPELRDYDKEDTLPEGMQVTIPSHRTVAKAQAKVIASAHSQAHPVARPTPAPEVTASNPKPAAPALPGPAVPVASATDSPKTAPPPPPRPAGQDKLVISADPVPPSGVENGNLQNRLTQTQAELDQLTQFVDTRFRTGKSASEKPAVLELQIRLAELQVALEKIKVMERSLSAPPPEAPPGPRLYPPNPPPHPHYPRSSTPIAACGENTGRKWASSWQSRACSACLSVPG